MAKKDKNDVKVKKTKNTNYFKEMKAELKKVVWPTPKELINNTVEVIVFVLVIAIIVFVLDFCFDNINKYGITRFQDYVQTSFKSDGVEQEENDNSSENEISNAEETTETIENTENTEINVDSSSNN